MNKITADVELEFRVNLRERLRLAWLCLRGGHFILIMPASTVNLNEANK